MYIPSKCYHIFEKQKEIVIMQSCKLCNWAGKNVPARYIQRGVPVCGWCTVLHEHLHCLECGQKCKPVTEDDGIEVLDLSCPCYDNELSMSCIMDEEDLSDVRVLSDDDDYDDAN